MLKYLIAIMVLSFSALSHSAVVVYDAISGYEPSYSVSYWNGNNNNAELISLSQQGVAMSQVEFLWKNTSLSTFVSGIDIRFYENNNGQVGEVLDSYTGSFSASANQISLISISLPEISIDQSQFWFSWQAINSSPNGGVVFGSSPSIGDEYQQHAFYQYFDPPTSWYYREDLAISAMRITSTIPIPAAAWLFGSALIGLAGIKRKK
jgi:hypothetical protein